MNRITRALRRYLLPVRHTIRTLHVLAFLPTHRCNCRCIMCDYWKNKEAAHEMPLDLFRKLEPGLKAFGTPWIIVSGGEALMHKGLEEMCEAMKRWGHRTSLLTNGLLMKRNARVISDQFDEVIVSLDGPEAVHDHIRGVSGAFARLQEGITAVRTLAPDLEFTGRTVLQRENCLHMPGLLGAAHELGLKRISFLPADISTSAFQREGTDRDSLLPGSEMVDEFKSIVRHLKRDHAADFASGFIAENPKRLLGIARYFETGISAPLCNAPWVSAVIEADGAVKPCFFHPPYGNLNEAPLEAIVNSEKAITFRRNLKISRNPICRRCVCPLYRP